MGALERDEMRRFFGLIPRQGKRPPYPQVGVTNFRVVGTLRAGDLRGRSEERAEALVPIQVGPGGAEADENPAAADSDFGSHLDQQAAPCAGVAFAERIGLAAAVEIAAPVRTVQCF